MTPCGHWVRVPVQFTASGPGSMHLAVPYFSWHDIVLLAESDFWARDPGIIIALGQILRATQVFSMPGKIEVPLPVRPNQCAWVPAQKSDALPRKSWEGRWPAIRIPARASNERHFPDKRKPRRSGVPLEGMTRIELASLVWKTKALPLSYIPISKLLRFEQVLV